jgi:hypothetical protein
LADLLPPNVRVRWVFETTLSGNRAVSAKKLQWREHVDENQQQIVFDKLGDVILQPMSFRTFVITCDV